MGQAAVGWRVFHPLERAEGCRVLIIHREVCFILVQALDTGASAAAYELLRRGEQQLLRREAGCGDRLWLGMD